MFLYYYKYDIYTQDQSYKVENDHIGSFLVVYVPKESCPKRWGYVNL